MIEVRYKCICLLSEVSVRVPYRREADDVVRWMEDVVAAAISRDHHQRQPLCTQTKMEYVKIPAPENAPFIGGKPEMHS